MRTKDTAFLSFHLLMQLSNYNFRLGLTTLEIDTKGHYPTDFCLKPLALTRLLQVSATGKLLRGYPKLFNKFQSVSVVKTIIFFTPTDSCGSGIWKDIIYYT